MKELLALVAVVLSLLVAYQMHRDRLGSAQKQAEAEVEVVPKKQLSEYLEPYRAEVHAPLNEQRPVDLVPGLQLLKNKVASKRDTGDVSKRKIVEAGLVAIDRMLVAAEHRTQILRQIVQQSARPTSSLERSDSENSASAFFKENTIRRANVGKPQRDAAIEQAFAQLRRVESDVISTFGDEAARDDYSHRRVATAFIGGGTEKGVGNPLKRAAYDQRQVIVPRRDSMGVDATGN